MPWHVYIPNLPRKRAAEQLRINRRATGQDHLTTPLYIYIYKIVLYSYHKHSQPSYEPA